MRFPFLCLLLSQLAVADGGMLLFHQRAGDLDVSVFGKSEAVRAGPNDFSVLVERKGGTTVMNATVLLRLARTQDDGQIMRLTGIATHAKATNKTLYATSMNIPSTGQWRLDVEVTADGHSGVAGGRIDVLPPQPPIQNYWPFVAMVPALGIALIINRKLRARFRPRLPR